MKNEITQDSYELLPDVDLQSKTAIYTVKINVDPYRDTVIRYGSVTLKVSENKETAKLSFKYDILESSTEKTTLLNDREFSTLVGDLLAYIIQNAFDTGNYQVGEPDKSSHVQSTAADDTPEARQ